MYFGKELITLTCTCPFCGDIKDITVTKKDFIAWDSGALIQRAFPYLDPSDRERLMTGICPTCWEGMFGLQGEE